MVFTPHSGSTTDQSAQSKALPASLQFNERINAVSQIDVASRLRVCELNSIGDLDGLEATWNDLLSSTVDAHFFHTLEWLRSYWRHFGRAQRLRLLIVEDGDCVVGIVPMVVRSEPRKVGQVRILTYPLDDWGSFFGPLGRDRSAILRAAFHHLAETPRDWDLLDVRFLAQASELAECTRDAFRNQNWQFVEHVRDETSIVSLPETWDDFLSSRPSKVRHNLRRFERRIRARGHLRHVAFRPEPGCQDPRWDLYDECVGVASRSWQGASLTGTTLSHPEVHDFLRETHQVATQLGAVDLHLLYLDGLPLAFTYNYHWRGRVYGLRSGFDASLSRDGVGNTMYACAIRHAIARGDVIYDLGPGSRRGKRHFADRIVPVAHLQYFHPLAPKAQLLRVKHWLATAPDESPAPGR